MATVADFIREWESPEDYIVAHTSGSTGTPKPIHLLKSDMLTSARATVNRFGLNKNSVLALPLSPDYIAGKMMIVRSLVCGARLIVLPVSNDINLKVPVDFMPIVPTQIRSVLENCAGMIRNLLVGGAPMSREEELALTEFDASAWLGYGMTETCSHVALRQIGSDDFFTAMPGIQFETEDDNRLVILSDNYSWRRLPTNDIVDLETPTRFRWLGRGDNVIISGGLKIHPERVESEIRSRFPSLPPFYIIGRQSTKWGQEVTMVIEGQDVTATGDLLIAIKEGISDSRHAPKRIETVFTLPRTANGKIKRV